jgi:arginyl-tRNA synthetase
VIHYFIEQQLQKSVSEFFPGMDISGILVRPCPDKKFGDYQTSALISLAKERKANPRQFANEVLQKLDIDAWCEKPEIAGPGFVNFRIKLSALSSVLADAMKGEHLFYHKTSKPKTVVIDFSSPNVAKPMHVGHIRSTILGDCLARNFRLLGHNVITDNHIGDWGTQFGKLILAWKKNLDRERLKSDPIGEMERLYKEINAACDADAVLYESARQELALLQGGSEENLAIWNEMIALSKQHFNELYRRLGVHFDFVLGESFYNPRLKSLVQDYLNSGIARESEGAIKIFFDDNPELKDHPAVIQKNDGAATYTTTDLATLEYRLATWSPQEIIYVTDGRQQLHFKEIFNAFSRRHSKSAAKLVHVWFGSILGEDGKPFKTRSGEVVKLVNLLNEAEERALKIVSEKNPDLNEAQRNEIARIIGLGAVKYADLLPNRQSDYVFSWDKMLAMNGNTAPYLQYAYTRIRSIFRKMDVPINNQITPEAFAVSAPAEIALAKHLLNFGLVLEAVALDYRPNYLCNYLFELAGFFASFYESCPVLKAPEPVRTARISLCDLTSRVLKQGLEVLGIETTEQM